MPIEKRHIGGSTPSQHIQNQNPEPEAAKWNLRVEAYKNVDAFCCAQRSTECDSYSTAVVFRVIIISAKPNTYGRLQQCLSHRSHTTIIRKHFISLQGHKAHGHTLSFLLLMCRSCPGLTATVNRSKIPPFILTLLSFTRNLCNHLIHYLF